MIVKDLFRYHGTNGDVDTLIELPMEGKRRKRIEAGLGMMLTNGDIVVKVRDMDEEELDQWYEIEAPAATTDEATEADYIAALNELGVDTSEES